MPQDRTKINWCDFSGRREPRGVVVTSHRISFDEPWHAHELKFSCYRRYPFPQSERTCQRLAEAIVAARTAKPFLLWASVFMPDHVHLVLLPTDKKHTISSILKAIRILRASCSYRIITFGWGRGCERPDESEFRQACQVVLRPSITGTPRRPSSPR